MKTKNTHGRSRCACARCGRGCQEGVQITLLVLAVVGGACLGTVLRLFTHAYSQPELHPREMMYLYFPAELFIRFLSFITVPFLVCSLISGIGSLDAAMAGKLGARTLLYYILTTCLAVTEGFVFVYTIRPGSKAANHTRQVDLFGGEEVDFSRLDSLLDMLRNVFPENIATVLFKLYNTRVTHVNVTLDDGSLAEIESIHNQPIDNVNILGLTLNSLVFGIALVYVRQKARVVIALVDAIFATLLRILLVSLWLYPLAVLSMVTTSIVQVADPLSLLEQMFMFVLTVLLGLFCHTVLVLPALYLLLVRRNPYRHMLHCGKALVTAFVTNNSSMTIPATMQCLGRTGIHDSVIRFMVPIGATVNMDGFALYESLSCIFIATLNGMNPSPMQVLMLGLTAVAVSIGAPSGGGGGVVLYVILFKSIGLPLRDIALLIPFDWILIKFRAVVNVWGDCVGAGIVNKLSSGDLQRTALSENIGPADSGWHSSGEEICETDPMIINRASLKESNDCTVTLEYETEAGRVITQV